MCRLIGHVIICTQSMDKNHQGMSLFQSFFYPKGNYNKCHEFSKYMYPWAHKISHINEKLWTGALKSTPHDHIIKFCKHEAFRTCIIYIDIYAFTPPKRFQSTVCVTTYFRCSKEWGFFGFHNQGFCLENILLKQNIYPKPISLQHTTVFVLNLDNRTQMRKCYSTIFVVFKWRFQIFNR